MIRLCAWAATAVFLAGCGSTLQVPAGLNHVPLGNDIIDSLAGCYTYQGTLQNCSGGCQTGFFSKSVLENYGEVVQEKEGGSSADRICLEVEGQNLVRATVFAGSTAVEERVIEGELGPNGYFRVKGFFRVGGSPFPLIWGPGYGRAQIGVKEGGGLIVSEEHGGFGFFLLIPVLGTSSGRTAVFQKWSIETGQKEIPRPHDHPLQRAVRRHG